MEGCIVSLDWRTLDFLNLTLIGVAAGLCAVVREYRGLVFGLSLLLFYAFTFSFHCDFKVIDPERIWRYGVWTLIDITFIAAIVILARYRLVEWGQVGWACLIELVAIFSHFFRVIDLHVFDLRLSSHFYSEAIFSTNVAYVLLAFWPVFRLVLIGRETKWN